LTEAAWLATTSNTQDTHYRDRTLVGILYCDCCFIFNIHKANIRGRDPNKTTCTCPLQSLKCWPL